MQRPYFNTQISLGNLLTLVALMAAGGLAFGQVQSKANNNAMAVASIVEDLDARERDLRAELDAVRQQARERGSRLRAAEQEIARGEERLSNILTLLGRIDNRLERIEFEQRSQSRDAPRP